MQKNNLVSQTPDSDKTMNDRELTRAIRQGIASEEEFIQFYESEADTTENMLVKTVFQDMANTNRERVGKLQQLLNLLLPDESKMMEKGAEEVSRIAMSRK